MAKGSCRIYKSLGKDAMYLALGNAGDFARIPALLLEHCGKPAFVMRLALNADRRLARINNNELLSQVQRRGWYLQMPPADAPGPGAC